MTSYNDNGFPLITIPYVSDKGYLTEGAIIGIAFAWIIGAIGFYILGMCLIRIIFKRWIKRQSQRSSNQPRRRKQSSSSDQPAYNPQSTFQKSRRNDQERDPAFDKEGPPKRKKYQQTPTLQMINVTQQNDTFKKMTRGYNPNSINLDLNQQIEPKQQ